MTFPPSPTTSTLLAVLWGKTKDGNPNATVYHPLLFHLSDVGNAARELWHLLPATTQVRIADALGVTVAEAERVVVLLAGLHDLGKASAFQTKAPGLWADVREAGLDLPRVTHEPHAFVTADAKVLPQLLTTGDTCGFSTSSQALAVVLAEITGAHHGKFPPPCTSMSPQTLGDAAWTDAREKLAAALREMLCPDAASVALAPAQGDKASLDDCGVGVLLTALISVADWLGSNTSYFPLTPDRTPEEYAHHSRARANDALTRAHFKPAPTWAASLPFEQIVWGWKRDANGKPIPDQPIQFDPNALQKTVAGVASRATGPYLMIVEAAMGQGKTECALYATDCGLTRGLHRGLYFALPTQATGNAMFRRVRDFLEARGHSARLNLQLVHGGSDFNTEYEELKQAASQPSENEEDAAVVAEGWFVPKKQALLAPLGVGTIDQSLIGVLQTKHWFVRLFGLGGKVVVFDEVHAYDVYMGTLLETLIAWLGNLGCTVILLSATLPRERCEKLIKAYRPGATVPSAEYPRVTYVPQTGDGADCQHVRMPETPKEVNLDFAPSDYATLADRIREEAAGGCAAVICNTVNNAQAAYAAISDALAKDGWTVTLLHARTLRAWRDNTEKYVLERFGKDSTPEDRENQVLISTQIIESSLDLDFDWMASEMAPVDLLLQRMGRLHRHPGRIGRPADAPCFTVLVNSGPDGLPRFPGHTDKVYEPYILLRSYLALQNRDDATTISLPADIEPLIVAAYDGSPSHSDPAWASALKHALGELKKHRDRDKEAAKENYIAKPPGEDGDFSDVLLKVRGKDLLDEDDPSTHKTVRAATRLGDLSMTVVCLRKDPDGNLRPFHLPADAAPVNLNRAPTRDEVRTILQSALTLSRPPSLYRSLAAENVPRGWEKNAYLKYARLVTFEAGEVNKGGLRLFLDAAHGLQIEQEPAD